MSKCTLPLTNFSLYRAARRTISRGFLLRCPARSKGTIAHSVAPTATKISFWPAVSIFDSIGSSLRRSSADMPGSALEFGSAITIRQREGTGPRARREH